MVDFSFAIVNWNTKALLDACIDSIYREKGDFRIQILVADNASHDGSADLVAEKYPEVELVRNHANLGFAKGHATLFPKSKGRFHVLVNSDVRMLPGCLKAIDERMRKDLLIGVLGCKIIGPDNEIQPSCRRFPSLTYQFLEATGLGRLFPRSRLLNGYKMGDFDHNRPREVDQVMGALFVIRDQVIQEIGYLDTAFFMYYEEVDYCKRCRMNGYKVFYESEACVWHEGGGSSKMVKSLTIQRTMRSMRHYFRKHHGVWSYPPLLICLSLDTVTHFLYALITGNRPLKTLQAYSLGLWDFIVCRPADS